jgi:hypothetical protein
MDELAAARQATAVDLGMTAFTHAASRTITAPAAIKPDSSPRSRSSGDYPGHQNSLII